jgi:hypothetical protein
VLSSVSESIVTTPCVARLPDQSPDAVQLSALLLCQVSVILPLRGTVVGEALRATVVAGLPTKTFTVSLRVPPGPVQVRVKVLFSVSESIVSVPCVALLPDQSPDALQLSALLLSQVKVVEPLRETLVGFALRLTAGGDGSFWVVVTVTLTEDSTLPLSPVQVRLKTVSVCNWLITSDPEVPLFPDQPPEALQLVVFVLLQVKVVESFGLTVVGLAVNVIAAD